MNTIFLIYSFNDTCNKKKNQTEKRKNICMLWWPKWMERMQWERDGIMWVHRQMRRLRRWPGRGHDRAHEIDGADETRGERSGWLKHLPAWCGGFWYKRWSFPHMENRGLLLAVSLLQWLLKLSFYLHTEVTRLPGKINGHSRQCLKINI